MAFAPAPAQAPPQALVIEPARGWARLGLRELWDFRELLYFFVWRELKARYRQTALGPAWVLVKPVLAMVVFTLVFGRLAALPSDGVPYPLFAFAALLPWTFFAEASSKSALSLVGNTGLIAKVYFPRLIVPVAAVFAGLVDFAMASVVLAGLMIWFGVLPGPAILALPLFLALAVAAALAVGLWLATLAVRFRDVGHAFPHVLQFLMFASPVVYPTRLVPEAWQPLYRLNPMTQVIDGFRWALVGAPTPPDLTTAASAALVALLLAAGAVHFRRRERTIVDVI